jgi:hypothetical protein
MPPAWAQRPEAVGESVQKWGSAIGINALGMEPCRFQSLHREGCSDAGTRGQRD